MIGPRDAAAGAGVGLICQSGTKMAFVEYEGDFTNFSGELLAGWFIANPNGPTAGALGLVEVGRTRKLFYRWMHFTGGKTWLSSDLTT